jgi:hypothetical protein
MVLRKLTRRDEEFLTWLLDPRLFGERVPGPSKIHRKVLSQIIKSMDKLPKVGHLPEAAELLKAQLDWWENDARAKINVHRSPIQQRSQSGSANIELTERLFLASLIARRRGPSPYRFVYDRFEQPWFSSPKAIEMRVLRFERHLEAQGPMSCRHIANMKYHQFISSRRNAQVLRILRRYDGGKVSYETYSKELTRLIWPNSSDGSWLDSLCQHASRRPR